MEICYIPQDFDGAGSYRCLFPASMLSMLGGHRTIMPPYRVADQTEKFIVIEWMFEGFPWTADLYVFQMPKSLHLYKTIKLLQRNQRKVVVDLDDDHRHVEKSNPAYEATRAGSVILDRCVRTADAVTVATPALEKSYREVTDAPIYVLRNYLDWRMWRDVTPVYTKEWDKFRVRVGYVGNLKWHSDDLLEVKPFLSGWLAENPDVGFVAAGDPAIHDFLSIPRAQRITVDSVSFRHLELPDIVATFNIGIVPLADNLFNQSKSHLKGLEYAGSGIPSISSPSESYTDYWLPAGGTGGTGFLARGPGEWIQHLDCLATDGELRNRMGLAARQLAEQHTIQEHWQKWEEVYDEVMHRIDSKPPRPRQALAAAPGKRGRTNRKNKKRR